MGSVSNRLASATSPYLLQHADNPVDWWEWGTEAFEEARARNVPLLLSVGYAACHWCHVMAHESFEDDETAAYLNEHFVSVKVDREERPDVDAVYMNATQAMTGQGGWPMTCVLDHDGTPFFAGTYFPEAPRHGMPGFRQVLEALAEAWQRRGDDVRATADRVRAHLQATLEIPPATLGPDALAAAVETLAGEYDARNGGFGGAPKFPPSMVLEFLHRHAARTGDARARDMRDHTLEAMARSGMYDQLGGGFARYAVDAGWVVPHFEKMLYDNAQLLGLYARTGQDGVARETADFLLRELRTPEGGFASALDADSEGVEGKFYAWTPDQLVEALGDDDGAWAAEAFAVTAAGTFEHGTSTLQLPQDPDDPARLARVKRALLTAREDRVRPARDDKVVAAWNGLAISGLCDAGLLLDYPEYVDAAAAAGRLLVDVHLQPDGRLRRVSRAGEAGRPAGVLEDHGCVAGGFLSLAQATGDATWLARAGDVLDRALDHFRAEDGGFHDTADDAEALVARPRELADNASPSGQSAMVHALAAYAALTGSARHRQAAEETLGVLARVAERAPRFAGWALAAAEALLDGPEEIAVVGPPGPARDALAAAARRRPGAVVVVADAGRDDIPLLVGRAPVDGRPAAYVCRQFVCARPITEPADLAP